MTFYQCESCLMSLSLPNLIQRLAIIPDVVDFIQTHGHKMSLHAEVRGVRKSLSYSSQTEVKGPVILKSLKCYCVCMSESEVEVAGKIFQVFQELMFINYFKINPAFCRTVASPVYVSNKKIFRICLKFLALLSYFIFLS